MKCPLAALQVLFTVSQVMGFQHHSFKTHRVSLFVWCLTFHLPSKSERAYTLLLLLLLIMMMIMTGIYCSTQLNGNRNLLTSLTGWHQPIMGHMAWPNNSNINDEDHMCRVIAIDATVTIARTSLLRAQVVVTIVLEHWARFLKWYVMFLACIVRRNKCIISGKCPAHTLPYALHLEPLDKVILKATHGQPANGLTNTHNVQTENISHSCLKISSYSQKYLMGL